MKHVCHLKRRPVRQEMKKHTKQPVDYVYCCDLFAVSLHCGNAFMCAGMSERRLERRGRS